MDILEQKIFCSLDIETSDFDAQTGEVLEVGFVLFKIEKQKIVFLSEWQSTFKPSKPVPPRILALTGISPEQLENSPLFRDRAQEIQEQIADAIMVGHNINFDIKFLESFGIKFSGRIIDTLDLAQMFLPTASSYNLESLMNFLGVEHKSAHRALADSKAVVVVIQKLLSHFGSFPDDLKEQLYALFKTSKSEIKPLFSTDFAPELIVKKDPEISAQNSAEVDRAIKEKRGIITFPLGFDYHSYIYGAAAKSREKTLIVVPNKKILYQLWQKQLVFPCFENQDIFDNSKFEKNLKKKLSEEQRLFFAKILIWKKLNWQSEVLVDINFSFGSQFKQLICFDPKLAPVSLPDPKRKVVAIDYFNFINNDFNPLVSARKIIILDINNFESALAFVASKKVSWGDFIYTLKQFSLSAKAEIKKEAEQGLSQVDLFFGLASMNLKKLNALDQNILITKEIAASSEFEAIAKAAQSFSAKIIQLNKKIKSEKIEQFLENLKIFFVDDPKMVRWAEISEGRLVLFTSPADLSEISEKKIGTFKKIIFTASLGSDALIKYFVTRLNLREFVLKHVGQQELRKKFEVVISPALPTAEKILEIISKLQTPAAVLLPNSAALRDFYEQNFQQLQKKYKVSAQSYSGGANKLIENFAINENSLFLATDKFVLKQFGRKVRVKNLVITRLPFEQFNHPLFTAQAEKYQNQFVDFNIPRALYNFHSLIKFFYSEDLERILILDQKINKDYGKYFLDYLSSLPFVELKS